MRVDPGQVGEPRLSRRGVLDEALREAAVDGGHVAGEVAHLAVDGDALVGVVVDVPDGNPPVVPARRLVGQVRDHVLEVVEVLADDLRPVDRVEVGRDRVVLIGLEGPVAAVRRHVVEDVVVVRIQAGQEGRPRRAAQRHRRVVALERRPLVDQHPLDVGHLQHVGEGRVVEHHQDDIRRLGQPRRRH